MTYLRGPERRRWAHHHVIGARLFVISYAPLGAIAAIQLSDHVQWSPSLELTAPVVAFWLSVACVVAGGIDAVWLPRSAKKLGSIQITLREISDEGGAVGGYLATYLLPFLGFSIESWRDLAAVGIYAVVLFVVFVRSDLGLVNPTLYLAGHRVVRAMRIRASAADERVLVVCPSGTRPRQNEPVAAVKYWDCFILKGDTGGR